MKSSLVATAVLFLSPCLGCSQTPKELSPTEELTEAAKNYDEAAKLMKKVTDRDSYEKAKSELIKFEAFQKGFQVKRSKYKDLKDSPEWKLWHEAALKWVGEWKRVFNLPEVGSLYEKEVMKTDHTGTDPGKSDPDE